MTPIQSDEVEHFSRLFQGYEHAYGKYEINHKDGDGKLTGQARTIPNPATIENYHLHLEGKIGIGIIPLLKDEKCWFGAIDLDIKGDTKLREDHFILEARIKALKLPLLLCKSKSNGAHLYLFGSEPISSRLMQSRLAEFAALLGYGGCEVFPKQVTRLKETDYGNWINLPYFGEDRWAIVNGKQTDRRGFIGAAHQISISEAGLRAFKVELSSEFTDGPPCLQQLCTVGFHEGGRNNALFNVAVYYKKKDPDNWQDPTRQFNSDNFDPPLPESEVHETLKSASKKDYNFTCKQHPIVNHCNKKLCKTRAYGVATGKEEIDSKLPIQSLTQYIAGDSCRYGVNTGEVMIEFSEEEFFSIDAHRKKLAATLRICIPAVKQDSFFKQIQDLLGHCEVVIDPDDASESGVLLDAFEAWFSDRGSAANVDDMVKGNWWQDPETEVVYFRHDALIHYLGRHKDIKKVEKHKTFRLLKKHFGVEEDRLLINGERKRVWKMENYEIKKQEALPTIGGIQQKDVL